MLINISNHPSSKWDTKQLEDAKELSGDGIIKDIPFPKIDPMLSRVEVSTIAISLANQILQTPGKMVIHIMGEQSFVYYFLEFCFNLREDLIPLCICSTTERRVVENEGVKTSVFEFVRFRSYY